MVYCTALRDFHVLVVSETRPVVATVGSGGVI
jgi:hypothetical protein